MREFHQKHQWYYVALAALALIVIVSGTIILNSPPRTDQKTVPEPTITVPPEINSQPETEAKTEKSEQTKIVYTNVDKSEKITDEQIEKSIEKSIQNEENVTNEEIQDLNKKEVEADSKPDESSVVNAQTEELPANSPTAESTIEPTLKVGDFVAHNSVPKDATVYQFMEVVRAGGDFDFVTVDYGSNLGMFVKSINGIENGQDNHYWIYYINGKKATIGISHYHLQAGDIIEWNYEKSTS